MLVRLLAFGRLSLCASLGYSSALVPPGVPLVCQDRLGWDVAAATA